MYRYNRGRWFGDVEGGGERLRGQFKGIVPLAVSLLLWASAFPDNRPWRAQILKLVFARSGGRG